MITHQCPTCDQTTIETYRFILESTDGPIEHIRTVCPNNHIYLMPTAHLAIS